MPARDTYHDAVRNALVKDGWTITHDPFNLVWDGRTMYADLGVEQFIAAEQANRRIVVEIKSFLGKSILADLEQAIGQFVLYRLILEQTEPERELLLAIPFDAAEIFEGAMGRLLIESNMVRVFSFDPLKEEIVQWLP